MKPSCCASFHGKVMFSVVSVSHTVHMVVGSVQGLSSNSPLNMVFIQLPYTGHYFPFCTGSNPLNMFKFVQLGPHCICSKLVKLQLHCAGAYLQTCSNLFNLDLTVPDTLLTEYVQACSTWTLQYRVPRWV